MEVLPPESSIDVLQAAGFLYDALSAFEGMEANMLSGVDWWRSMLKYLEDKGRVLYFTN